LAGPARFVDALRDLHGKVEGGLGQRVVRGLEANKVVGGEGVIFCALVVPSVDVVLQQAVALPVGVEWTAALLVDKRVGDRVGAEVADPTKARCQELLAMLTLEGTLLSHHLAGVEDELVGNGRGVSVVDHL